MEEQAAQEENLPDGPHALKLEHDGGVVEWVAAAPAPTVEPIDLHAALELEPAHDPQVAEVPGEREEPEQQEPELEAPEQEITLETEVQGHDVAEETGQPEEPAAEPGVLEQELASEVQEQVELEKPEQELEQEETPKAPVGEAEAGALEQELVSEVPGKKEPEQSVLTQEEETVDDAKTPAISTPAMGSADLQPELQKQPLVEPDVEPQDEKRQLLSTPPPPVLSPVLLPTELTQADTVSNGMDYKSQLQSLLSDFQEASNPYDNSAHDDKVEEDEERLRRRDLKQQLLRDEALASVLGHKRDSPTPPPEEQAEEGRALALLERDPTAAYNAFAEV